MRCDDWVTLPQAHAPEAPPSHRAATTKGDAPDFYFRANDQEQFPQLGIVSATGRHPPPPRVAGPAEAQLTRKGQLRLVLVPKANNATF
jgi:hypothetical protein